MTACRRRLTNKRLRDASREPVPRLSSDGGRGGPSLSEVAKLRAENERLRKKLTQAEVIIEVQGKVHALLEDISKSAATDDD